MVTHDAQPLHLMSLARGVNNDPLAAAKTRATLSLVVHDHFVVEQISSIVRIRMRRQVTRLNRDSNSVSHALAALACSC